VKVEEQNRNWWIPRFGLRESLHVEKGLKERYCRQFREGYLQPLDRRLAETLRALPPSVGDDAYASYVIHIARRINILRVSLERNGLEAMGNKPQPAWLFASRETQAVDAEANRIYGELNQHYLAWRTDPDETRRDIAALQAQLGQLYAARGPDLQWLMSLADRQGALAPVTLDEFWGGGQAIAGERQVPARYTSKGRQVIDDFYKELEEAWPEAPLLAKNKVEFDARYRALAFEARNSVADGFSAGTGRLKTPADVQQAAAKMAQDGGPFFALMNRITTELDPLVAGGQLPTWLAQVLQFQLIRAQGFIQEGGALSKAAESGKQLLATVQKKIGRDVGGGKIEQHMAAAQAFGAYKTSLAAIEPAAASRNHAFQLTSQVFSEDSATSKSPFYTGYAALEKLKNGIGDGKAPDETVGRLLSGPLDFLWGYVCRETASHLEGQWNEQVLAPVSGWAPGVRPCWWARTASSGNSSRAGGTFLSRSPRSATTPRRPSAHDPARQGPVCLPEQGGQGPGRGSGQGTDKAAELHPGDPRPADGSELGRKAPAPRHAPRAPLRREHAVDRQLQLPRAQDLQLVARCLRGRHFTDRGGRSRSHQALHGAAGLSRVPEGLPGRPAELVPE
jgi:type VI secretion system protein ImpL